MTIIEAEHTLLQGVYDAACDSLQGKTPTELKIALRSLGEHGLSPMMRAAAKAWRREEELDGDVERARARRRRIKTVMAALINSAFAE